MFTKLDKFATEAKRDENAPKSTRLGKLSNGFNRGQATHDISQAAATRIASRSKKQDGKP